MISQWNVKLISNMLFTTTDCDTCVLMGKMEENRTNQGNIPGLGNVEEILRLKDEDCWKLPQFIKDFVRHWSLGQIKYNMQPKKHIVRRHTDLE